MVSPANPTRASSAMVASRTFSTTCWLRGPRCTPVVRRVDLSMSRHASTEWVNGTSMLPFVDFRANVGAEPD
jgi:hypothetical protein